MFGEDSLIFMASFTDSPTRPREAGDVIEQVCVCLRVYVLGVCAHACVVKKTLVYVCFCMCLDMVCVCVCVVLSV